MTPFLLLSLQLLRSLLHRFERGVFRGVAEEQADVRLPVLVAAQLGALATDAVLDPLVDHDADGCVHREFRGILFRFSLSSQRLGLLHEVRLHLLLGDSSRLDGFDRDRRRFLQLALRFEVIGVLFGHRASLRRRRDRVHNPGQLHAVHLRPPLPFPALLLAFFFVFRHAPVAPGRAASRGVLVVRTQSRPFHLRDLAKGVSELVALHPARAFDLVQAPGVVVQNPRKVR